MKSTLLSVGLSLSLVGLAHAEEKVKIKLPHQHKTHHGGRMHMVGDSHFEVVGKNSMLMIYFYDKFGEAIAVSEYNVAVALVEGDKKQDLKFTVDKKESNLALVNLPKDTNKETSSIELTTKKINPSKGELVIDSPLRLPLRSIASTKGKDPHAEHNM